MNSENNKIKVINFGNLAIADYGNDNENESYKISIKSNQVHRVKDGAVFSKATAGDPIRDEKDLYNFLDTLQTYKKSKLTNLRNYCIFMVGLTTGLRISDVLKLKICDILTLQGEIRPTIHVVEQKTGKTNIIPKISTPCAKAIYEYLKEVENSGLEFEYSDYLWISFTGRNKVPKILSKPLSQTIFYNDIVEVANETEWNIPTHVSTHTMRKTFGYFMYQKSTDKSKALLVLQEWFNHSSPRTTLRYIGLSKDEKLKAFDEFDDFISDLSQNF